MKKGYDVFGPAYGVMLRNDLHALESIDHKFMREMILLEEESYDFLYHAAPVRINMEAHLQSGSKETMIARPWNISCATRPKSLPITKPRLRI